MMPATPFFFFFFFFFFFCVSSFCVCVVCVDSVGPEFDLNGLLARCRRVYIPSLCASTQRRGCRGSYEAPMDFFFFGTWRSEILIALLSSRLRRPCHPPSPPPFFPFPPCFHTLVTAVADEDGLPNQPLRKEKGSFDMEFPTTRKGLTKKRREFWETEPAYGGDPAIWAILQSGMSAEPC